MGDGDKMLGNVPHIWLQICLLHTHHFPCISWVFHERWGNKLLLVVPSVYRCATIVVNSADVIDPNEEVRQRCAQLFLFVDLFPFISVFMPPK